MGRIKILDETISNIIAAGEVVENPASMIKELIENSLDAGATRIKIQVKNSGRDVRIVDNGYGMVKEDMFMSIERHATSKISKKDDIFNLSTYGFRGEALASIASVSKLYMTSRREEDEVATKLSISAGNIMKVDLCQSQVGTEIEVKDLFFNTPARLKFLRTKGTEYTKIKSVILAEALANFNTAFSLDLDGKEVIKTSGKGIKNIILELFGPQVLKNMKEYEQGFLGNISLLRSTKDYIFTYVNNRYVKSAIIEKAIIDAYYTKLLKNRYPFAIIFLEINPEEIDVNVHPSKKIVKFSNEIKIYALVKNKVEESLNEEDILPVFSIDDKEDQKFALDENEEVENKNFEKKELETEKKSETNDFFWKNEKKSSVLENKSYNNFKEEKLNVNTQRLIPLNEQEDKSTNNIVKEKIAVYRTLETKVDSLDIKIEEKIKDSEYKEKNEIKIEKNNEEKVFKIIGQLRNMYILVEREKELYIYDQHIVHERILYEELKDKYYSKSLSKQNLLVPLKLELDYKQKELVEANMDLFNELAYEIEDFGRSEILIRAIPVFDFRASIKETFEDILEKILEGDKKDIREKIIISMSCKNAIKAGEKLEKIEMELLLKKLHYYNKYTCPHGRPIIIKFSYNEIDKLFGRKWLVDF